MDKIRLSAICGELKADSVKTSTGYGTGGATPDDIILMRKYAPAHVAIKAAGGVRTLDQLLAMRALGVSRCGTAHGGDPRRTQKASGLNKFV